MDPESTLLWLMKIDTVMDRESNGFIRSPAVKTSTSQMPTARASSMADIKASEPHPTALGIRRLRIVTSSEQETRN